MAERRETLTASVKLEEAAFVEGAKRAEKAASSLEEAIVRTQRTAATPVSERSFIKTVSSFDPAFKAQQDYDRAKSRLEAGFAKGLGGDATNQAAIVDRLNAKYTDLIPGLNSAAKATEQLGKSTQMTRFQMMTVQYTINDVIASLASGANPLTILLQQGGQVTQAWGGLGNTLRALLSPTRAAMLGLAALGGGLAVLISGANKAQGELAKLQAVFTAVGNGATLSDKSLLAYLDTIQRLTGASRSESVETLRMLANYRQIGPQVYGKLIELAGNYAAVTGTTVPQAMQSLISGFQRVVPFASELTQKYGLLTQSQYENIKSLQDSGRGYEAQNIILEKMIERFKGLRDQGLTPLDEKLKASGAAWDRFVAKIVNSDFTGGVLDGFVKLVELIERIPNALSRSVSGLTAFHTVFKTLMTSDGNGWLGSDVASKVGKLPEVKPLKVTIPPGGFEKSDTRSPEEIALSNQRAQDELDKKFRAIVDENVRQGKKYADIRANIENEIQKMKEQALLGGINGDDARARKEAEFRFKNMVKDLPSEVDKQAYVDSALKEYDILKKTTDQTKELQKAEAQRLETITTITSKLATTLSRAFVEGTSAAETFRQFYLKMLEELIAKSILRPIISPIVEGGESLLSGGGAGGIGSFITNLISGGFSASGGSVYPGHSYTVGENGPETFVPAGRGQIAPSQSGKASSPSFNFNVTVSGPAASDKKSSESAGTMLAQAARSEILKILQDERRPGGSLWSPA